MTVSHMHFRAQLGAGLILRYRG